MTDLRDARRRSTARLARASLVPLLGATLALAPPARAQATGDNGAPIEVRRITNPIEIDGDLSDPGWGDTVAVDTWFETNPGDNIEPAVRNLARLGYDDQFLYAAFEFEDPEPSSVRAPLGDRDDVRSYTDYGGVILDATNDAKSAQMFLANAAGIQYDALTNDASGEDSSPDFFWESAGRITERGWQLEMRIPFSSIRYQGSDPSQWGVLLYRNRPRDFRYQYFSSRLPRERSCFICNVRPMVGLAGLPDGAHWVVAPYVTAGRIETAEEPGARLGNGDSTYDGGLDAKWIPNPDTVIDVAINPDFSQIEADVPVITANERFAIFQPEKRPFFLESVDLFSTPIDAVYTRTFTSPRWGARATGGSEKTKYTLLAGEDRGGGSVILPGSNGSSFADQDFGALVAIGRVRREFGDSFASFLYAGREIDGGGFNRVFGPDFQWRPNDVNTVTGQLLFSTSQTPDRPDLAEEWDGRDLSGHAAEIWWQYSDAHWDLFTLYEDVADDFRADNGFVPQVGYRKRYVEGGHTFRFEEGRVRRVRAFSWYERKEKRNGDLLSWEFIPGFGLDAALNSFFRLEYAFDEVLGTERTFRRRQLRPYLEIRPGRFLSAIYLEGNFGDQVDFVHDRPATGGTLETTTELRPTDHLQLSLTWNRRWLDVDPIDQPAGRLFTAEVSRLRGVYTFNSRTWLRLVAQWIETEREPRLWDDAVESRSGDFAGSLVFAYKLNWQTVLYVGYADTRALDDFEQLQRNDRQAFLKISYALRR